MLTLQDTFTYDDTQPAPVNQANIVIGFPQYEAVDATDGKLVTLTITGQGSVSFKQIISTQHYHVSIPTSGLWGQDYGTALIRYFQSLVQNNGKPALQDVTTSFSVSYGGNTPATSLDALYFIQGAHYTAPRTGTSPVPSSTPATTPPV